MRVLVGRLLRTPAVLAVAFAAITAAAQSYPHKPVTIVVPFPPGAIVDTLARAAATPLSAALGQPVIVDNKPGADTLVGTQYVSSQPADGYTVLFGVGPFNVSPEVNRAVNFDFLSRFTPVAGAFSAPYYLFVSNAVPANNLKEFVAYAKANPGKLNYGSTVATSTLAMEHLKKAAGIELQHVPYKGAAPVFTALTANEIQAAFTTIGGPWPLVKAGKFKVIASTSPSREQAHPDIQTMSEAGVPTKLVLYLGVFVRTNTPKAVVSRLNVELNKIMSTDAFQKILATGGVNPLILPADDFPKLLTEDLEAWKAVVRATNYAPS